MDSAPVDRTASTIDGNEQNNVSSTKKVANVKAQFLDYYLVRLWLSNLSSAQ